VITQEENKILRANKNMYLGVLERFLKGELNAVEINRKKRRRK